LGRERSKEYQEALDNFIFIEKMSRLSAGRSNIHYEPTDSEIQAYYLLHPEEFAEDSMVSIQQLILEDLQTARKFKAEVDSGANFHETAMRYHPGQEDEIKEMTINLGWITPKDITEEFFYQVYRLEENQISEPIKTKWGYHVVRLLAKQGLKPLETVRVDIRRKLIDLHAHELEQKWDARILAGVKVRVDYRLLREFGFVVDWLPKPDFSRMFPKY